jgi:hypothetical protein
MDEPLRRSRSARRPFPLVAFALLAALALVVLDCGSGSSSDAGTTAAANERPEPRGEVKVVFQPSAGGENKLGRELLEASETEAVAKGLANTFELPNPLLVKGVKGIGGGPFYNPEDNSITLPYGFAALIF